MGSSQSSRAAPSSEPSSPADKSLYQRMQEKKRGPPLSDEDIKKYTGKSRDELNAWAGNQPGVGKNQLAGKLAVGGAPGLAGTAAGAGYGGWGPGAEPSGPDRGMKFPPKAEPKAGEESSQVRRSC
ncbi:hypothetical protein G6O67_004597 [Ophiocordyceps sinensis]|uniref:Uncharacterized protein n=2 Tax=Ophiocordyceps sinensis TaxID=72228 RepID=A0A8H4PPS5_9HYPO|nr:hypothetical protein OCS_06769 [Ophiocordyceps sinensis CO18]KAF4508185.1 hypothetical protein G6O67_004597 [Ophiocordyceps sinensis]